MDHPHLSLSKNAAADRLLCLVAARIVFRNMEVGCTDLDILLLLVFPS
jgi:hypothetical protein